MAGTVVLVVLSAAALLTSAHGANLSLYKQVKSSPTCTGPSAPFPNPTDCSTYYQCTSVGHAALLSCPPGLEFSAQSGSCDYPENAKCSVSSPSNGDDTSANDEKPSDNDGSSSGSSSLPECPYPADPYVVVHFPNPEDCSSFYKCGLDGKPVLIPCQEGLEWNDETEACDYPENAKCSVTSPSDGEDTSDNNEKPSDDGESSSGSSSLPECPYPADPYVVVHFPNPEDCSSFYKCGLDGKPVLIPCQEGLEWNDESEACDYPENAKCSVSSGGSTNAGKPAGSSNTPPPECPYPADPNVVVQYPNPDDCSSFYKCGLDGEPVLIPCPEGLEWNAEANYCDYPESAGCTVSSGNSASANKPAGASNTPPPECPYPADPANVVQYPNPDNCSTFYKCGLDGEPVLIECPEGLEYNAEAQVCDFPATAGCTVSSDSSASANKPAGTSNTPPPECPYPADPNVVVQYPNPDDCSSFYKCGLDGKPVLIPCPEGLEWNAEANYCDYPESAGCTVSSGNSGSASKPAGNSKTPPPECPYPADPDNVVQYPNPDDCSTFYKCSLEGEPVLIECPEGLEYNAEAQVCDYPASAGCSVAKK